MLTDFAALGAELARIPNRRRVGRVTAVGMAALEIAGLSNHARIGDQVAIGLGGGAALGGEIVGISESLVRAMTYAPMDGAAVGDAATLLGLAGVHPDRAGSGGSSTPSGSRSTGGRSPRARRARRCAGRRRRRRRARASAPGSPPGSRSSTPCCRWRGASASASSPARASASRRCSPTSPAASRPRSSSTR